MNSPVDARLVSIILPTYNGSRYIAQALESCLNQSYRKLEIIVIDDGSTDDTAKIVSTFHDQRIVLIRFNENKGHIAALNKGFSVSRGEFLTWTSDDNYYELNAIQRMVDELESSHDIDFVYAGYNIIDTHGKVVRKGKVEEPHRLDEDNYVGGCFLYRRKVYETVGDFNPEAFLAEDYEYWLRVRRQFQMRKLDETLYHYRSHEKSLTGVHKEEKVLQQVRRIRLGFVPQWKRNFFLSQTALETQDRNHARDYAVKSILGNPFYFPAWRLFFITVLSDSSVASIRTIKKSFSKDK